MQISYPTWLLLLLILLICQVLLGVGSKMQLDVGSEHVLFLWGQNGPQGPLIRLRAFCSVIHCHIYVILFLILKRWAVRSKVNFVFPVKGCITVEKYQVPLFSIYLFIYLFIYYRAGPIYGEWGFIIFHKSKWGFMDRPRIFVPINPHSD